MASRFNKLVVAFTAADSALVDMLLQETDKRVAAQVDLLKAGDARALGLVAAGVAVAAAGVAIAAGTAGKMESSVLFWASTGLVAASLTSSSLAAWALWPCKVEPQGWDPDTFLDDAASGRPYTDIKIEAVALLQRRLDKNRLVSLILGSRAELALVALLSCPVLALILAGFAAGHIGWSIVGSALVVGIWIWLVGDRERRIAAVRNRLELPAKKEP